MSGATKFSFHPMCLTVNTAALLIWGLVPGTDPGFLGECVFWGGRFVLGRISTKRY
eukprot:UN14331